VEPGALRSVDRQAVAERNGRSKNCSNLRRPGSTYQKRYLYHAAWNGEHTLNEFAL